MAPGAPVNTLVAEKDMLGNVDVTGRVTATARFMGGREFAAIAQGADPHAASLEALHSLVQSQTLALPSFAEQGGPFAGCRGVLQRHGQALDPQEYSRFSPAERATLAAVYCAQMCAWLSGYLWAGCTAARRHIVVEGPLAQNPIYMQVLQALVPGTDCLASTDPLDGTARGAWLLTRWGHPEPAHTRPPAPCAVTGLPAYHAAWVAAVSALAAGNPQP